MCNPASYYELVLLMYVSGLAMNWLRQPMLSK